MPKNEWYYRMKKAGMVQQGHVVLSSGYHTGTYINCALPLITLNPIVDEIVEEMGEKVRPIAAQKSGIIAFISVGKGCFYAERIAWWCTQHYPGFIFRFAFAQRLNTGLLTLPYNQRTLLQDAEIIVVDDVHMTGRTFHDIAHLINGKSSRILQYLTIVNRGNARVIDDGMVSLLVESLVHLPKLKKWGSRSTCPLCKAGVKFSTSIEGGYHEFFTHGQPEKVR